LCVGVRRFDVGPTCQSTHARTSAATSIEICGEPLSAIDRHGGRTGGRPGRRGRFCRELRLASTRSGCCAILSFGHNGRARRARYATSASARARRAGARRVCLIYLQTMADLRYHYVFGHTGSPVRLVHAESGERQLLASGRGEPSSSVHEGGACRAARPMRAAVAGQDAHLKPASLCRLFAVWRASDVDGTVTIARGLSVGLSGGIR
jgi:hypothetical protein